MDITLVALLLGMAFIFMGFGTHYRDRFMLSICLVIFLILSFVFLTEGGGIL
jgi:hypothetical protein